MAGTANIDNQSLRGFLRMVESEYPDEFLRIRHEIDPKFESTAMLFELDRAGRSPVVVFENIKGQNMPLVTNVAGNRKLLAACLGVKAAESADGISRALSEVHPVRGGEHRRLGRGRTGG